MESSHRSYRLQVQTRRLLEDILMHGIVQLEVVQINHEIIFAIHNVSGNLITRSQRKTTQILPIDEGTIHSEISQELIESFTHLRDELHGAFTTLFINSSITCSSIFSAKRHSG